VKQGKLRERNQTSVAGLKANIFRKYFVRKQLQKILENVLKHQKYLENSQNSRKIPRDTLEHEQSK
jgi:hypothetical protein